MVSILKQYLGDREKVQTLAQISLLVLLLGAMLSLSGDVVRAELKLYYGYSLQVVQGKLPYRDFPVEYPPLTLLPMLVPQWLNAVTSYQFGGYEFFFYAQNILLVGAIGQLILKIAALQQLPKTKLQISMAYGILIVVNSPFIFWRCDIFCAWLTVWATWLLLTDRPLSAGAVLGLGTATKLYPALLIPIFALHCLAQRRPAIAIRLMAGFAAVIFLLVLLLSPLGWENLLYFFNYHKLRGLQLESLASGLLILAHILGWTSLNMVVNYGALHLESPVAPPILQALPLVFALGVLATLVSYCNRIKHHLSANRSFSSRQLTIYILAILSVFILTNKVFSPQYLIWLLPFIPLLPFQQVGLFSIVSILTFLIYPVFYGFLIEEQIIPILILNCRNYLIVVLAVRLIRRSSPRPSRESLKSGAAQSAQVN